MGAQVVPFDPTISLFTDASCMCGWAAFHVDDICVAGGETLVGHILGVLARAFPVKFEKREAYFFVECSVSKIRVGMSFRSHWIRKSTSTTFLAFKYPVKLREDAC